MFITFQLLKFCLQECCGYKLDLHFNCLEIVLQLDLE